MSAKPDEPDTLATGKKEEAEDPRKLRSEMRKDPIENQTHNKILSTNDTNLVEFIDSRQQENLESHDMDYKSLIENNEIDGLPVEGCKSGDQHLRSRYNQPRTRNSANDTNLVEFITSRQQVNLESHDGKYKSLIENKEVDGFK